MEQIDILMATYNGEMYLKEQIESILNQTYSNIRLIISDDCSKDGTVNILKEYEKKDKRVKVYYQKENVGSVKNFNFLLEKVENEIFALSDQDDVWLPEKIEKCYFELKQSKADLIFTDLEVVDENLKTIEKSFNNKMNLTRKIQKTVNTYKLEYLYNCVTGCTIMTKKKFLKYILPIPQNTKHVIHDHWIALVVSLKGKIVYLPESLIKYRQHSKNQIGAKRRINEYKTIEEMRQHFIDVKLGVFGLYMANPNLFSKKIQEQNTSAYEYFKMLNKKKKINFRNWNVYHKLYKNETFWYYIENFFILNMPCIIKILFKKRNGGENS